MEFTLNPSSGYADSYLDIGFTVKFEECNRVIVKIFNHTINEHLNILGVSNGYILHENEIVCKDCTDIQGYINIFNNDKMNKKFSHFGQVQIKCEIERHTNNDVITESKIVSFYNEGQSVDASIVPFVLSVKNNVIDISRNEPLELTFTSSIDREYFICIKSTRSKDSCELEVHAQKGQTTVFVPSEFLYHDLNLSRNGKIKYGIYYIKFQGMTHSRLANRQYTPTGHDITFTNTDGITPASQKRVSPLGSLFNGDFVVSDRYLVMCPKEYSGFSGKSKYDRTKLLNLTLLLHESQDMESIAQHIRESKGGIQSNIKHTEKVIQNIKLGKKPPRPQMAYNQVKILKSVSGSYDSISASYADPSPSFKQVARQLHHGINAISHNKRDCLPCTRSRRNA